MGYFPFYIDVTGKTCLIVGAGTIACKKAEILVQYEITMRVIAKEVSKGMEELQEKWPEFIQVTNREFEEDDLSGVDFCIAATSSQELNHQISVLCKAKDLLVNVVDVKEDCSFIMPGIIHSKEFDIAISTGGKSPAAVRYMKDEIIKALPRKLDLLISDLGLCRNYVMENVKEQKARKEVFEWLLVIGIANDYELDQKLLKQVVQKFI